MKPDEFFRDLYQAEWERYNYINSAIALPAGILTLLGGGLLVLVQGYRSDSKELDAVFWIFLILAFIFYLFSALELVLSLHGYVYRRIPLPSQINGYRNQLIQHFMKGAAVPIDAAIAERIAASSDTAFREFLASAYIEACDRNSVNNIKRGEHLYMSIRLLVFSLAFACVSALAFGIGARITRAEPYKVQIVTTQEN